jgi:hypothetical protein
MAARDDYPLLADCAQSVLVDPDDRWQFTTALDEIDRLRAIADRARAVLDGLSRAYADAPWTPLGSSQ